MRINRQKELYQRNMLVGQAVALGLAATLSLFLLLPSSPVDLIGDGSAISFATDRIVNAIPRTRSSSGDHWSGADSKGLIDLRFGRHPVMVDDDRPVIRKSMSASGALVLGMISDTTAIGLFDSFGSGDGSGFEEAYQFPDWEEADAPPDILTRSVTVISSLQPVYPLIARDKNLEGSVDILLLIDSLGGRAPFPFNEAGAVEVIVDHLILNEEPTDWFFGSNAYEAIKDWQFGPAVENGLVVSSYVKITIHYSLSQSFPGTTWRLMTVEE